MSELEEQDVLKLQQAYIYLPENISGQGQLYAKLNQIVIDQALNNQDDVSLNFLLRYLSTFFDLSNRRGLSAESMKKIFSMFEQKVADSMEKFSVNQVTSISKILIKNEKSQILAETLKKVTIKNARTLSSEESRIARVALKKSLPEEEFKEYQKEFAGKIIEDVPNRRVSQKIDAILQIDFLGSSAKTPEILEGQKRLLQEIQDKIKTLSQVDAIDLVGQYSENRMPSSSTNDLMQLIMKDLLNVEAI